MRVENILRDFACKANPLNFDGKLIEVTEALCELFYDEMEYKYRIMPGRPKGPPKA